MNVETAGFEPASCNTHLKLLHAYPFLFLQDFKPGKGTVLKPGLPFVSPSDREREIRLSPVL